MPQPGAAPEAPPAKNSPGSSQDKRNVAFKDRAHSLEAAVQSSYQTVDATLTELSNTIKTGHEKTLLSLREQKFQSDVAAVEAKLQLKHKEREDELTAAYHRELAQKLLEKDKQIAFQVAIIAEKDTALTSFKTANDDFAKADKSDLPKIKELEEKAKELERQNRVAKQKLEAHQHA